MPETISQQALMLRPPEQLMRLSRLGSFHASRISFMRCLLRRIAQEHWTLKRTLFDLDAEGYGTAVYRVETPQGVCSLVAFSHELKPEERTDRVIAEKWDATFALCMGEPFSADIERLRAHVPKQEAGRCSSQEIVLSRANKSVRLFEHMVNCLAHGWQPTLQDIVSVGYLMRTTAVYGNGKFGLSDLANTFSQGLFKRPFEAEMLAVYLIREFTLDLVEHCAAQRAPEQAVKLAPAQRRALGIGNSTGLGMAPFLVNHPTLIHHWVLARETAIARVLAVAKATPQQQAVFNELLERADRHVREWKTQDARQSARLEHLRDELQQLATIITEQFQKAYPWQVLTAWACEHTSEECQELLNSLMIECYGELVDDLADAMCDPEIPCFDPVMNLAALRELIEQHYGWALLIDFTQPSAQHYFWYRSAEKEEPRLGERCNEPGAELEMRLGVARTVQALHRVLAQADPTEPVAAFLLRQPEWRHITWRVQTIAHYPYGEIHANLLAADCLPIDLLRCKLAFFGAIKFDPKSDRWTRITMYQGAPGFSELNLSNADSWFLPVLLEPQTPPLHT